MKCGVFGSKKGDSSVLEPQIIYIVIILLFFAGLFFGVSRASTGAVVYEQVYAKQIALLIDKSQPEMEINLSFEDGFKVAEKNEVDLAEAVKINPNTNEVIVKLGSKGGYKMKYFSDCRVEVQSFPEENLIKLVIKNNE